MSKENETPSDPGWDDLTPEQKQRLVKLADSGGVTRRDVLAGGGAVGIGALLGGGASQALTEPASASHGGGSVGGASNPVDVLANSVATEGLNNVLYASENLSTLPSISSALSTAENQAPATVAVVDPGTHLVNVTSNSSALYWDTSGVSLYLGAGVTLKMDAGNDASHIIRVGSGADTVDDVAIYGHGIIDGNSSSNSSTDVAVATVYIHSQGQNCVVEDVTIQNAPGNALRFEGESGTLLEESAARNLLLRDCGEGINFHHTDGLVIESVDIRNTTRQDGIEPNAGSTNWEVRDCSIHDTGQQGVDVFGGASKGQIRDVTVVNSTDQGIDFSDTSNASSEVTVKNCTVVDAGNNGIAIRSIHSDIDIEGCTVRRSTGGHGVAVDGTNITVKDCTLDDNDNAGVNVADTASGVFIAGCTFIDNQAGGLGQLRDFGATDAYYTGNSFRVTGTAPDYAIYLDGTNYGYTSENVGDASEYGTGFISDSSNADHTVTNNHT